MCWLCICRHILADLTGAPAYFIYASCRLKSGVVNRLTRHCFVCISYFYNRITVSLFVLDASVILQDLNMEDTDIFFGIVTKMDSQGGYISHRDFNKLDILNFVLL